MQVNATIIAAQQAAREARAALMPQQAAPKPAASFLAALDKEGVEPAPAKTAASATSAPAVAPQAPMRPGSLLDIKI
jgi:hypothetical protein